MNIISLFEFLDILLLMLWGDIHEDWRRIIAVFVDIVDFVIGLPEVFEAVVF